MAHTEPNCDLPCAGIRTKERKKRAKRQVLRLSKALKANYDVWLDWTYYGVKLTQDCLDLEINEVKEVSRIVAQNTKRSMNHWKEKNGESRKEKEYTCADSWAAYRLGEIPWKEVISYVNPISQTKISHHNRSEATFYYVNKFDAPVSNLMLDFDDKKKLHGDTRQAAEYLNREILHGLLYIQPSTSLTGTHAYLFVRTEGISVLDQKLLYRRLANVLRKELVVAGFRCGKDFDRIKGIHPVMSWVDSSHKKHAAKPWWLKIEKGGVFAKLPRLPTPEDEERFINRKQLTWTSLRNLVHMLEEKLGGPIREANSPEPEWEEQSLPAEIEKHAARVKLEEMFDDDDKQRVALATVFKFEILHSRRPTEADFPLLNQIYNTSPTHTEETLKQERIERFRTALKYSEGRGERQRASAIPAEAILRAQNYFCLLNLDLVNQRLQKKERRLTSHDLGRVWTYVDLTHRSNQKSGELMAPVPYDAIRGLAGSDFQFDPLQFPKLADKLITVSINIFIDLGMITVLWTRENQCREFTIHVNPLAQELAPIVATPSARVPDRRAAPTPSECQWDSQAEKVLSPDSAFQTPSPETLRLRTEYIVGLVGEDTQEREKPQYQSNNEGDRKSDPLHYFPASVPELDQRDDEAVLIGAPDCVSDLDRLDELIRKLKTDER